MCQTSKISSKHFKLLNTSPSVVPQWSQSLKHVDASWLQRWTGQQQTSQLKLEDISEFFRSADTRTTPGPHRVRFWWRNEGESWRSLGPRRNSQWSAASWDISDYSPPPDVLPSPPGDDGRIDRSALWGRRAAAALCSHPVTTRDVWIKYNYINDQWTDDKLSAFIKDLTLPFLFHLFLYLFTLQFSYRYLNYVICKVIHTFI